MKSFKHLKKNFHFIRDVSVKLNQNFSHLVYTNKNTTKIRNWTQNAVHLKTDLLR